MFAFERHMQHHRNSTLILAVSLKGKKEMIVTICHLIWKERNSILFREKDFVYSSLEEPLY